MEERERRAGSVFLLRAKVGHKVAVQRGYAGIFWKDRGFLENDRPYGWNGKALQAETVFEADTLSRGGSPNNEGCCVTGAGRERKAMACGKKAPCAAGRAKKKFLKTFREPEASA